MRISIWQQFSSNHSGGFEVVGVFASEEQAEVIEKQLHEMFRRIADFRGYEHTEHEGALTWPETEYSQQFSIPWSLYSINWILPNAFNKSTVLNVTRFDRYVFVSNLEID